MPTRRHRLDGVFERLQSDALNQTNSMEDEPNKECSRQVVIKIEKPVPTSPHLIATAACAETGVPWLKNPTDKCWGCPICGQVEDFERVRRLATPSINAIVTLERSMELAVSNDKPKGGIWLWLKSLVSRKTSPT